MVKFEEAAAELNIKSIFITLIVSALGFLVALQWRDVIKETILTFIPKTNSLLYNYGVTVAITIAAVVVTYVLMKIQQKNIIPDIVQIRVKEAPKRVAKKAVSRVRKRA